MRVCHISTVHNFLDDRILYKECKTLAENGYKVYFVVQAKNNTVIDQVNILALKESKGRLNRILLSPFNALFKALKTKSKIYHIHDPELIFIGIILKLLGKKIIYDVHEDIPKQILSKNWIKSLFIKRLFSNLYYYTEKISILFFDAIITVTEDIIKKFPSRKSFLIKNYPNLKMFENYKCETNKNNKKIIIYVGGLSEIRGIFETIEAVNILEGKVELWLLGSFDDINYFEKCKTSIGWQYVNYLGFKKLDEVYKYIAQADIGLSLLYPIKNYLTSLPVKVFEYMALSKPVIMSDFPFWKEKFSDCAVFANPYNTTEIADRINELISDEELMQNKGTNGKTMVYNNCSWESESFELLEIYKNLLA